MSDTARQNIIETKDTCAKVLRLNFALKSPAKSDLEWAKHEHKIVQLVCGADDVDLAFFVGEAKEPKSNICVCQGCSRRYFIDPITAQFDYRMMRETRVAELDEDWECDVCEAQYLGGSVIRLHREMAGRNG